MVEVYGYLGAPSQEVRRACADAALVVAGARALDGLGVAPERRVVLGRVMPAIERLQQHAAARAADPSLGPAVVLASGDPLFYGVVRRFRAAGLECRVHPGVSSVAAAFAAVGLPWDDAQVASAHGHGIGPALAAARALPKVAVLTAPSQGVREIAAGLVDVRRWFVLAERLGEDDERVRVLDGEQARALEEHDVREPHVLLVLDAPPHSRAALGKPTAYVGGTRPGSGDLDDHPERAGHHVMPAAAATHHATHVAVHDGTRDGGVEPIWGEALSLAVGRHLPVLGETVWSAGAPAAALRGLCARTGAAVIDVGALVATGQSIAGPACAAPAHLPDPDLVVLDDPSALGWLVGRRPGVLVLLGTDDTAQACAAALDALDLPGDPVVEHLAVTGEDGRGRSSYLITLVPPPVATGGDIPAHPGGAA